MKVAWTATGWEDYLHWQSADPKVLQNVNALIRDIKRDLFKGLGKPEPLKHRESYQVEIAACRHHYL
jgi:toxin YoeB